MFFPKNAHIKLSCCYRGFVSNSHPSEVMPLQWPEVGPSFILQPGAVQLGVSIEPQGLLSAFRTSWYDLEAILTFCGALCVALLARQRCNRHWQSHGCISFTGESSMTVSLMTCFVIQMTSSSHWHAGRRYLRPEHVYLAIDIKRLQKELATCIASYQAEIILAWSFDCCCHKPVLPKVLRQFLCTPLNDSCCSNE